MERFLKEQLKDGKFHGVGAMRSRIMSCIPGRRNRSTEIALRFELVRAGVRGWKMHFDLPGRPDFFFPKASLAIFVDGCFWHGCPRCGHIPKTRTTFWAAKIGRNRQRDAANLRMLHSRGIRVLRIWEHSLGSPSARRRTLERIRTLLQPN
jgi:DNA mismatch endonuclease, patch repair protein